MSQWIWSQSDLMKLAEHRKPKVRRWACERLKILYGKAGIDVLERLLKDRDRDVLLEALEYLENHLDPKFKDTLLKIYQTQTGVIAGKCALFLGKLKDERLVSAYQKRFGQGSVRFEEIIPTMEAFGELASPPAKTILRRVLSEMEEETDSFVMGIVIHALIIAKEDLFVLLEYYAHHYKDFALEILRPLTTICGSWYSLADLKKESRKKLFRKDIPFVVSESFSYLKEKGLVSLEETLRKAFKKQDYRQVIAIAWDHARKKIEEKGYRESELLLARDDFPPLVNCRVLGAFKDFAISGPEDSLRNIAVAALVILARFIEFRSLLGLKIADLNEERLFQMLFEERGTLEIDDRLMGKLFATCQRETIFDHSIRHLKDYPHSWAAERAIRLLGMLKDERAIPDLVGFLKGEGSDVALNECIKALSKMGGDAVDYLNMNFNQLNEDQQLEILFALENIPEEKTADLLLRYWDRLWAIDKESFLCTLEGVASKRFIDPLLKELREGELLEAKTFYLLCHIHGVENILLPEIEKEMMEKEKEADRVLEGFVRRDGEPQLHNTTLVELKCRQCVKSYHYEVETIYLSRKGEADARIGDKIVCKNCKAINQYEITSKGRLAITGQMVLMGSLMDKGKLGEGKGPIKFVEEGLFDGRRMPFDDMLKYYKKEVEKRPNDPALRVGYGNILMKEGREEEAVFQYQEALRLDPLAVEAYYSLGEYEADKGNPSGAYEYFKKATERIHTGHYYRTKEIDQLKEAAILNLEHYEGMLERGKEANSIAPSQGILKREKVGRNDPCPCGSGKKYKKCCLLKDEARKTEKTSATPKEIELRDQLLSFSAKERYKKDFEKAYRLFWRRPFKESLMLSEKDEANFAIFLDWFVHDFILKSGMTIVEEFYQEKKQKLSQEAQSLIKYEMASYLSVYGVISVTAEVGLRLKDLFTGEEMDVLEVKGSLTAVKWDVILARVIRMEAVNKLSGIVTLLPRRNKEEILTSIRDAWERFKKETDKPDWSHFAKTNAHIIHHLIEDQSSKKPIFVTDEHHTIVSSKAVFDVKNFEAIRYRLSKEFDFIIDEEIEGKKVQFSWLKRGKSKDWEMGKPFEDAMILKSEMIQGKGELRWTSLGTVTLTPKRLALWCTSKERLDRGKGRVKEILGDEIHHRIDTYEDMVKKAMKKSERTPFAEEGEMPEKFLPFFKKTMEEFVTKWIDEKIPALDGKTPREAVKTPEGREKVEDLLKDWENMEERRKREGEPYIDINILRQILNL